VALQDLDLPSDLFMHIHVLHLSLVYDLDGHLHKHVSTPLTVVFRGSLPRVFFHVQCGDGKEKGNHCLASFLELKECAFCPVRVCSAILTLTRSKANQQNSQYTMTASFIAYA